MSALKLVSVNIERSKHLDLVVPFVRKMQPDVLCVQELLEKDIPLLSQALGTEIYVFEPMSRLQTEFPGAVYGVGLFTQGPMTAHGAAYYVGSPESLPSTDPLNPSTFNDENRMLLWCDVSSQGKAFRIATTHFTWTPKGQPSDEQRTDMRALLKNKDLLGEHILTGDFNAPRGGEIFAMLTEYYQDNIPPQYKTSIDVNIHRAGKLRPEELADKMVDGLFSTPTYTISDAALHSGVSDHMAVSAQVHRVE